jgi:enediyne biosynthesis protein E4
LMALTVVVSTASAQDAAGGSYFVNIAPAIGMGEIGAQRAVFVDLNSDGWLDAVLDKSRVFMSESDPGMPGGRKMVEATEGCGLNITREGAPGADGVPVVETRPVNVLIFADIDNDGDKDAYSAVICDFLKPAVDQAGNIQLDENGQVVYAVPDAGWRSEIFINDGTGHFTVKEGSGVDLNPATTYAGAFLDCDKDGMLDLFEGNWYKAYGITYECYQSRGYKGFGNGIFEDATDMWGLTTSDVPEDHNSSKPVYGVTHTDWNNDGWQDIMVMSYGREWNLLWEGGPEGFTEVSAETHYDGDDDRSGIYPPEANRPPEQPFRSNGNTFDCTVADFDNDGDIDGFTGEIHHWWAGSSSDSSTFLINGGAANNWVFTRSMMGIVRQHELAGATQWNEGDLHTGAIDFDNDGLLDLLIGSSDYPDGQFLRLYKQQPDHTFVDITPEAGFNWEGCGGLSIADFDRDGDEDIVVGQSFMRLSAEQIAGRVRQAALFQNQSQSNGNHWLGVLVEGNMREDSATGSGANRSGIGARIYATCGDTTRIRELLGGAGHCGHQNPPEAHFGLGASTVIDKLEIHWPDIDGTVDTFENVPVDCFIKIDQATHEYTVVNFQH